MFTELSQWLGGISGQVLQWVAAHPHWAYAAVFLTALLESLAIVGLFVPGAVLMFGTGALVAGGGLALGPALLWAAAGAVAGDGLSFWLGRRYHQRLRVLWPFRRYPELVNRGVAFFSHHGGKSVLFARFVGPVRPILPAVAGMLEMPPARFFLANLASALLWAPAYILPGMVFAASLALAAEVAGRLAVLLVLLLAVALTGFWLMHHLVRWIQPRAAFLIGRALDWSRRHPRIRPLAGALLEPDHPEARGLAVLTLIFGLATLSLAWIATVSLTGADRLVYEGLQALRTPAGDWLLTAVTELADTPVILATLAAALAWLCLRGHCRAALHWATAMATTAVLSQLLKTLTEVARPISLYSGASSFSFPSSHTSASTVLFGFLAVLVARELRPSKHWLPYVLATLVVGPVAFSRLYLGAHWLSDVLAGLMLGLMNLSLFGIAYRRHPAPPLPWRGLTLVFLAVWLGFGGWHVARALDNDLARYRPQQETLKLTTAGWWTQDWQRLPAFRLDLADSHRYPLNLQLAGAPGSLTEALAARGWSRPPDPRWTDLLLWLAPAAAAESLPVLPQVHDGRYEALRLVRPAIGGGLWVVRLWRSRFALEDGTPLWVGSAARLVPHRALGLLTWLRTRPDFDAALRTLEADLSSGPLETAVRRRPATAEGEESGRKTILLRWYGCTAAFNPVGCAPCAAAPPNSTTAGSARPTRYRQLQ